MWLLGVESGSTWSEAVTSAVLVITPVLFAVPVICKVTLAPLARLGTLQMPVVLLYVVPNVGVPNPNVTPAGIWSVTCTFVAVLGPVLVRLTV